MAYATVPCGPFLGWTLTEVNARIAVLKAAMIARAPGAGLITSGSINGASFTYDVKAAGAWGIQEELAHLQEAKALVDDDTEVPAASEQIFSAR